MPITKDTIWIQLKKHLTEAEQEQVKTDSKLQAQIRSMVDKIMDAEAGGRIRQ